MSTAPPLWADRDNDWLGYHEMPTEAFADLPDHPAQRDTTLHAADLIRSSVLETPLVRHQHVSAVLLASGAVSPEHLRRSFQADPLGTLARHGRKLDGHTRTAIWRKLPGMIQSFPSTLVCSVFVARTPEASVRLYASYDSAVSQKGQTDTLQSTLRVAGIVPTSSFVKAGGFRRSLDLALAVQAGGTGRAENRIALANLPRVARPRVGALDVHEVLPYLRVVEWFKGPLEAIDRLDLKPDRAAAKLPLGMACLAAYLVILSREPATGDQFMRLLSQSQGSLVDDAMDSVYAVKHFEGEMPKQLARSKRGLTELRDRAIVALVLNAFGAWVRGTDQFPAKRYPYAAQSVIGSFSTPLARPVGVPPRARPAPAAVAAGAQVP